MNTLDSLRLMVRNYPGGITFSGGRPVLRAITQQPPRYDPSHIAAPSAGAVAAQAIRSSQIEAQRRSRRAGA